MSDALLFWRLFLQPHFDNGKFRLKNLHSTDVADTGEFTEEKREELINAAIEFLIGNQNGPLTSIYTKDALLAQTNSAVVERCGTPYFLITLDSENRYIKRYSVNNMNSLAVSFSTESLGPITVYLASEYQMKGYSFENTRKDPDPNYIAYGYDLLCPMSTETLVVPPQLEEVMDSLIIN